MKKLSAILIFAASLIICKGQSSNLTINITIPHIDFQANQASYTDTTNELCPLVPITGYYYPSNFSGFTIWQFSPYASVITSTNYIIGFKFLTTNVATTVGGYYSLRLYTNAITAPFYDSGNVLWVAPSPTSNTNISVSYITNQLPVNTLSVKTGLVLGEVSYKPASIAGVWYSSWLIGGTFQTQ